MFCRFMSLKDLNRLQQQAPDTSRPHRQSWSQPALRTRQKRRRQPYKTRLVTAKDWHPTLMNGTFEVRRTNSLSMWTKRMSRKKTLKKTIHFHSTHIHTHIHAHIIIRYTRKHTRMGLEQEQQQEMRAKASTKQATSVLRITKFDFYSAVLRKSNKSRINKRYTFSI